MAAPQPSQALAKRPASAALMPPPPPPKRIKRPAIVLDEETYTSSISHIIARDFFPGLLESDAQQEFLDAVESRDREWIQEAGAKLTQIMTPGPEGRRKRWRSGANMTPVREAGGATPRTPWGETPTAGQSGTDEAGDGKRLSVDVNMSLSAFQAKYTSEDNESFNALLDRQNVKRAEKFGWLLNGRNRLPSGRQIAWRDRQQKLLEQRAAQEALEVKYGEDGASKQQQQQQQQVRRPVHPDDRPAMPNVKLSQPRNALMFNPDSVEDVHQTVAQAAQEQSNAPPKAIEYDNTRLPSLMASAGPSAVAPSPSLSAVDAAIAGRPPRATESEPGYDGSETPRVNGYAFVDEEPTARELRRGRYPSYDDDNDDDDDDSNEANLLKLLTAGNSSAGGGPGGGPNPFRLGESSKREALHHAMVEKTARSKRAGGGGSGGSRLDALRAGQAAAAGARTPTPKFLSAAATPRHGGAGALTPAAQRLLGKVGTPVRGEVVGSVFGGRHAGPSAAADRRWTPRTALTPRRDAS